MNEPPTEWEELLANRIPDKGLVSRIYKEFLKLDNKKTTIQLEI